MKGNTVTCLLCGLVKHNTEPQSFHEHGTAKHELRLEDLDVARCVFAGEDLWEWELPDGRRWMRMEIVPNPGV